MAIDQLAIRDRLENAGMSHHAAYVIAECICEADQARSSTRRSPGVYDDMKAMERCMALKIGGAILVTWGSPIVLGLF